MRALIGVDLVRRLPLENVDIRDTKLGGFVVRCRATGQHTYRVQLGRGRWLTLGRVGVLEAAEARTLARKRLADVAHGIDPIAARQAAREVPTWRVFIDETYAPWARQQFKSADETVRRLLVSFAEFADVRLDQLSAFAMERWRTKRLKSGISAATVNRDIESAKAAMARAVAWRILRANPFAEVRRSKLDRSAAVRFLSAEEEARLRQALIDRDAERRAARERANQWRRERDYDSLPDLVTYGDRLSPIVLLAMNTGLRRGEIFNLCWRDIDFVSALLTVRGGGAKSGQTRVVPLNAEALRVMQSWKPASTESATFVFPGIDGHRLDNIKSAWEGLLEAAQVSGFRFHDLRHHFASRLVQAGVDLNTVRELLGHADLKMTLRYAHLAPQVKAAAVAKLVRA